MKVEIREYLIESTNGYGIVITAVPETTIGRLYSALSISLKLK